MGGGALSEPRPQLSKPHLGSGISVATQACHSREGPQRKDGHSLNSFQYILAHTSVIPVYVGGGIFTVNGALSKITYKGHSGS